MRPEATRQGERWLEQAEADRRGAEILFQGQSWHLACFIAQQVAEKAIKAFLYARGEEIVIGHSVEALCTWAAEYDHDFKIPREEVGALDGYYIPTRYPNGLPDSIPARVYTIHAARDALRLADRTLKAVDGKLRRSD